MNELPRESRTMDELYDKVDEIEVDIVEATKQIKNHARHINNAVWWVVIVGAAIFFWK